MNPDIISFRNHMQLLKMMMNKEHFESVDTYEWFNPVTEKLF